MPPRQRNTTVDVEDPSYDGVPTVRVMVDAEPDAEPPAPADLAVVEVPAIDSAEQSEQTDEEKGQT